MKTAVRVLAVQATPEGSLQGASVTYDVELPDGTTAQSQSDVSTWAGVHRATLDEMLAELAVAVAAKFA